MLAHLLNGTVPAGHVLECCEKELPQAIHLFMQLCLLLLFPPFQISPALLFSLASSLHFLKESGKGVEREFPLLKRVEKLAQGESWLQSRSTKGWGFCPCTSEMSTNTLTTAQSLLTHHGEAEAAQLPGQACLHSPYFHITSPMGIFGGKFSKEMNSSPTTQYFSVPFSPVL